MLRERLSRIPNVFYTSTVPPALIFREQGLYESAMRLSYPLVDGIGVAFGDSYTSLDKMKVVDRFDKVIGGESSGLSGN